MRRGTGIVVPAATPAAALCRRWGIWHARTNGAGIEFLRRDLAVAISVELIEQRISSGGKFAVVDAAVLVPILEWRGGGLIGGDARLVDSIRLIRCEATGVPHIQGGEFRFQSGDQFVPGQGAVMIGIIFEQQGVVAAMIIFIPRRRNGIRTPAWFPRTGGTASGKRAHQA